jgi:hypothetical protein
MSNVSWHLLESTIGEQSPYGASHKLLFCAMRHIYKCDLLNARVIIATYNQHARLLLAEPLVGDTPKSTQPTGADAFMKSVLI